MLNRRKFLALSAAAWPAMAFGAGKHTPLGVQLYTIRDLLKGNNLPQLLKQVRAIGYQELELFPAVYKHTRGRTFDYDSPGRSSPRPAGISTTKILFRRFHMRGDWD